MANRRMPARKCCMRAQICSHSVPQPSVRCSQQRFESVISVCGCRDRKNQMCIEMLRHRGADIRREESYLSKRTIGCAHRTSPLCHAKLECSPRQAQAAEIIGRLSLSPLASPSCHASRLGRSWGCSNDSYPACAAIQRGQAIAARSDDRGCISPVCASRPGWCRTKCVAAAPRRTLLPARWATGLAAGSTDGGRTSNVAIMRTILRTSTVLGVQL